MRDHRPAWPVPPSSDFPELVLRPLTTSLLDLDTAAYRASPRAIREHSGGRWSASETFTSAQNAPLVAQHEAEHGAGVAFAYAILDPSCRREIGCAYVRPLGPHLERNGLRLPGVARDSAILTYWLIDDEAQRPPHGEVLRALITWVAQWGAAPLVLRCLPGETGSVEAAEALGLPAVAVIGESPYAWFEIVQPFAEKTASIAALSTSVEPR